ncbi:FMN-binding glutamate synthase family protein [Dehalobacterium formicoaceticum]|uniref:FMN-binding glutamate synthase family protein n=1 Tax=Dehalobacterium formicoaceticum TaxID=51515 RepID=A0ABT1YB01_9FIRM|nr:FMN-binding glutamate synthase family protein [Dehalobacterium formicoaceticum]MCR6546836.1 FMN-binding glutamate synthase family protein [Dehalobacterium formicoaceticum]
MNQSHKKILWGLAGTIMGFWSIKLGGRVLLNKSSDKFIKILTSDQYEENIWEMIPTIMRSNPLVVMETNLRAQSGTLINRPFGSPKKFPSLNSLMFNCAQLRDLPTPLETPVDTSVVIGKEAKKPFKINLPLMVSAMAYGEALSADAKWSLAKGASQAQTAICSGEGPFLLSEWEAADTYIYMYNRGDWNQEKESRILKNCAAVEIQFGQGALGGTGHVFSAREIDRRLRKDFNFPKGKDAITHSRQSHVQHQGQLPEFVEYLKKISDGIPVGVKIAAGKWLEEDIDIACHSGVDYIVLDGAEAATKGSPPILADDFCVPTIYAVSRGAEQLYKTGFNKRVSLIASGKISTPGDALKAIALGADACYMGTVALFAIVHLQAEHAIPFEPPTQLIWYDGKYADKFNKKQGAKYLANFFASCKEELEAGIRSLGKTTLREVNRSDLFSLDESIGKGLGLPMAYESCHKKP